MKLTLEKEKQLLKDSIKKLQVEFFERESYLNTKEVLDYQNRISVLKDCYTKVLEMLNEERRVNKFKGEENVKTS